MQINPGVVTIEQVLLNALYNAGAISEANKDSLSKVNWMRSARTDKGVSAAGQCVSAKLECELDGVIDPHLVPAINNHLPEDIQVYGMLRATAGFNARQDCHRRRYEYMFPARLLGGCNGIEKETTLGEGDPRAAKLTSILRKYEGTHCFANFTDGLSGSDSAARRYMISVRCGQPFLPPNSGVYYVTVEVYGQSFLLHQIRKMVGLALFVYLGFAPVEAISVALCPDVKIPTPMAPALGLLLNSLTFDNYNKRFGSRLDREISIDAFLETKECFKADKIYNKIAEKERMERILENWFKTCNQKMLYKPEEVKTLHSKFILTGEGKQELRKAHVASLYPIKTTVEDFLDSDCHSSAQLAEKLRQEFAARYGVPPSFLARAPGRVIIIGEHLDYNGLPVIGAALTEGTMIAGCLDHTNNIEVNHLEHDKYADGLLRTTGIRMAHVEDEVNARDTNWIQYVSWGIKSLVQSLPTNNRTVSGGGRLLVGGNLPRAGGLASSSSLVTASALSAARLNRKRIPKQEIAMSAAEEERVGAGTRGGAVDHAISMCSKKDVAMEVSFTPHLGLRDLRLPKSARLFAVGSKVKSEKSFDDQVKQKFNLRAAECRIGAALLARRLDVHLEKAVTTPGQLLFQASKTSHLQCRTISVLREKSFVVMSEEEVISLDDVRKELDISEIELTNRFLMGMQAASFAVGARMKHVFYEAERVERFAALVCDEHKDDEAKMKDMGAILQEGQLSLQMDFKSSCPEIDSLVDFCLKNGALGSRMTGAGWGGFTVNLVPDTRVEGFLNAVIQRNGKDSVLEIKPSSGASIFAIHSTYGAPDERKNGKAKN